MEQNPLIVFKRSCIEKQSILFSLRDFQRQFPNGITINDVKQSKKIITKVDINYGAIDIADAGRYLVNKSVDFIITDPPYGGLVHYIDLSMLWLVWLKQFNKKYSPDSRAEITIKKGIVERSEYNRKLENAFKVMQGILKDEGYAIVTFHHQKILEWNTFVRSVRLSGFKFDKVTHQYNRRSGESNVSNPYGTSGADFYIRLVKHRQVDFTDDTSGLEHFIVEKAKEIISLRNQPTPYTILVSGLIPEMLQAGYFQPEEYKNEIDRILKMHSGKGNYFRQIKNEENKAGDYWWFEDPERHINYPNLSLDRRVEDTVISLLRRKVSVRFDDILSEIFRRFPNGLTPDPRSIIEILKKYAFKSAERWKIKEETINEITKHTMIIYNLSILGRKIGYKVFIGKREQPEFVEENRKLSSYADHLDLKLIKEKMDNRQLERVQMIDCVWINKNETVECVFEVENSTDFTSAIQRGSNLDAKIEKFMIIPESREIELTRITDPYFLNGFKNNNWKYLSYHSIILMSKYSKISKSDIQSNSKNL